MQVLLPLVVSCYCCWKGCSPEVDGVHTLLVGNVLCTFVTLQTSDVHPLLTAPTHFFIYDYTVYTSGCWWGWCHNHDNGFCTGPDDLIPDGFFDVGRLSDSASLKTIEDYGGEPVNQKRPVILVNAKMQLATTFTSCSALVLNIYIYIYRVAH